MLSLICSYLRKFPTASLDSLYHPLVSLIGGPSFGKIIHAKPGITFPIRNFKNLYLTQSHLLQNLLRHHYPHFSRESSFVNRQIREILYLLFDSRFTFHELYYHSLGKRHSPANNSNTITNRIKLAITINCSLFISYLAAILYCNIFINNCPFNFNSPANSRFD